MPKDADVFVLEDFYENQDDPLQLDKRIKFAQVENQTPYQVQIWYPFVQNGGHANSASCTFGGYLKDGGQFPAWV